MTDLHNEFGNSRFYNQSRVDRRSADALVGVSAGLIADGTINQAEAQFLKGWLESNLAHLDDPVINILFKRVQEMLSDGVLDADESTELFDILRQFSGLGLVEEGKQAFVASNQLPFTKPAPRSSSTARCSCSPGLWPTGRARWSQSWPLSRAL